MVVRRLLRGETGPTGGPAFTDLLGTCTAWGDGVMTLVPDSADSPGSPGSPGDGAPVVIALADVVSGKPVPPRPSHLTRVSARAAEEHTLSLWPGMETVALGEWVLRCAPETDGRLIKRANSCLAMGSPGRPVPAAASALVAFYRERGRQPMAQVERGSDVEREFAAAAWQPFGSGDALFLAAPLAQLHRRLPPTEVVGLRLSQDSASDPRPVAEVPGGRASAVLDGDWLAIHGLAVEPEQRRRGLATALLGALVEWGAECGARTVWLHVEDDNAPARALYDGLGFTVHHRVRYLVPEPSAP